MIDAKRKEDFYIDETNSDSGPVVRWNSNDRIPFGDMLSEFATAGWISVQTVENSLAQRKIEDRISIENYRKNYKGPSQEEMFEARAAFGAGARVYNVFTGTSYSV
jgi:hypothetical protein